ncbi:site-specific integrase [Oscillibacter valericigenes]|uniref:site-specific integrase n=1 Tax=Oscillibacter valericigenes TaxID=351091 RepID=UPI001F20A098|nr:site-specific integrase [Oscillibacter valericigenes]
MLCKTKWVSTFITNLPAGNYTVAVLCDAPNAKYTNANYYLYYLESPLDSASSFKDFGDIDTKYQSDVEYVAEKGNPTDACKPPRVVKKEIQPLDEVQVAEFLKTIQGHPHEYLYKITLFTGMREGEVLGLTWDCLDLDRGTLLIKQQLRREQQKGGKYYFSPPKNNKSRVLSLAPSVVQLFRLQKLKQNGMRLEAGNSWEENNLIFSNQTGGFLSYRTVYDCFKRIVDKIGSPSTRFHDLRHTYAVLAIKSGDDIKTVQENLGHATAAFTLDVYGHVTAQMRRDSADRMEQVIKSVSAG